MMTFFKVATLDNWSWLMRDIMAGQRAMDQPPFAWVMFVIYLVITEGKIAWRQQWRE